MTLFSQPYLTPLKMQFNSEMENHFKCWRWNISFWKCWVKQLWKREEWVCSLLSDLFWYLTAQQPDHVIMADLVLEQPVGTGCFLFISVKVLQDYLPPAHFSSDRIPAGLEIPQVPPPILSQFQNSQAAESKHTEMTFRRWFGVRA